MTPECSVFVGVSLDGFLARPNGDLDWLTGGGEEEGGDDHGYGAFIADIDTILMGRNTYEKLLTFPTWYYGSRKVVVLSHRPADLKTGRERGSVVEQLAGTPAEVLAKLGATGSKHIYVDGGLVIQEFLRAGLIQRLILSRLPVLIGQGIPLFGVLDRDIKLRLESSKTMAGGMVQSEYHVLTENPRVASGKEGK